MYDTALVVSPSHVSLFSFLPSPFYILLLLKAMSDAGVHMGFSREVSAKLVRQTALGSALYAEHCASTGGQAMSTSLRNDITSPAGTTASALYTLEKGNFRSTVYDAVWSAYRRSLELGGTSSAVGPGRESGSH